MLARENRLIKADDFRSTMKQGRKVGSDHLVIYLKRDEAQPHTRFGFVVAKAVGGAVKRNLVKRRMREIIRELLPELGSGFDGVVRALPGAAEIDWNKLREELRTAATAAANKVANG
ncbi:MAG: ribonuclease P protein component [Rhodoluna sp.]